MLPLFGQTGFSKKLDFVMRKRVSKKGVFSPRRSSTKGIFHQGGLPPMRSPTNEITHLWDLPPVRSPTNIAKRSLWKSFILLTLFGQTCFLKKLDFVIKKCEKGFSKKGVFHQEDFPPMVFSTKGFSHQWGLLPILLREVKKRSYFVTTFQSNGF